MPESIYTTEFRQLDSQMVMWRSHDPVFQPWQSPYNSMDGDPVNINDAFGASGTRINADDHGGEKSTENKNGNIVREYNDGTVTTQEIQNVGQGGMTLGDETVVSGPSASSVTTQTISKTPSATKNEVINLQGDLENQSVQPTFSNIPENPLFKFPDEDLIEIEVWVEAYTFVQKKVSVGIEAKGKVPISGVKLSGTVGIVEGVDGKITPKTAKDAYISVKSPTAGGILEVRVYPFTNLEEGEEIDLNNLNEGAFTDLLNTSEVKVLFTPTNLDAKVAQLQRIGSMRLNGDVSAGVRGKFGVATFSRTQNLRPILKINTLELWQEKNDNLAMNLKPKRFG